VIENFSQKVADATAKALGWKLDRNGFLIHPRRYDEEEAQRIWNEAYKKQEASVRV
jgi:hypothetical protein